MTDKPLNTEELDAEEGGVLPDREAMSLIATSPTAYGGVLDTLPTPDASPANDAATDAAGSSSGTESSTSEDRSEQISNTDTASATS